MKRFKRHFIIYLKNNYPAYIVDVSYPDIKKAGRTQVHQEDDRATITSSTTIKPKLKKKGKKMDNKAFICSICGNNNPKYLGIKNNHLYCRKCITFRGQEATDDYRLCDKADYELEYQPTKEQKVMSDQLVNNFHHGVNSLVHAVCIRPKTRNTYQKGKK